MGAVLAGLLGLIFVGILSTDTLCPEHRAWVQTLGALAVTGVGVALYGLVRGWSTAPFITFASALAGVAVGVIDAAHEPSRGRLIALGFTVVAVLALVLAVHQLVLLRWDRSLRASLRPLDDGEAISAPVTIQRSEREGVPTRS